MRKDWIRSEEEKNSKRNLQERTRRRKHLESKNEVCYFFILEKITRNFSIYINNYILEIIYNNIKTCK